MTAYRISPDVAWVEAADGDRDENSVWVSDLATGTQYELTDTGWLIWVLVAEGFGEVEPLRAELARIHRESDHEGDDPTFDREMLLAFLDDLARDGLLLEE